MNRTILIALCCLLAVPAFPAVGAEDGVASEYQLMDLKATAPEWWTPEVQAMADAAGDEGKFLNPFTGETFTPEQAAAIVSVPVGAPDYLFVRPGALYMSSPLLGALCTYNFVYAAKTQIGVAGHCVERTGDRAYLLAAPTLITSVGTVASFRNNGIGDDWALINIATNWRPWVDPAYAYVGGPSCPAWNGQMGVVKHAGHGIQTGLVASVPRLHQNGQSVGGRYFTGIGEISGGDSGSGVIQVYPANAGCALGSAAGIVTHCASLTGLECLPIYYATDVRLVPATVSVTLDPL